MKFYSVPFAFAFAAMAVLFHGSDHVYVWSSLRTDAMADADAPTDHRSLRPKPAPKQSSSSRKCLRSCLSKCRKECPIAPPPPPKHQVHSRGDFEIGWDMFKPHNKGVKTVGSPCHHGCKRHSYTAYSENESHLACGGQLDTRRSRWVGRDVTNCRVHIPYCRHHTSGARCEWEIKEVCS